MFPTSLGYTVFDKIYPSQTLGGVFNTVDLPLSSTNLQTHAPKVQKQSPNQVLSWPKVA